MFCSSDAEMFFTRNVTLLLSWLMLLEAIFINNAKSEDIEPHSVSLESIATDLDKAKAIFKRNFELQHQVTIDRVDLEQNLQVFGGNYFTSGILRLNFSYKKGDETVSSSVLLKIPQIGPLHEYGQKMLYYPKELYMYTTVIPLMYENVPYEKLSPVFYGSTDSGILILEDLRESGYQEFPKGTLLEFAECQVVWKSLAQFHALSTRLLDDVATRTSIDSQTIMDWRDNTWTTVVFDPLVDKLKKYVLPLCSDSTQAFFDNFIIDFCSKAVNPAMSPSTTGRNVILHGDAHLSNILFHHAPTTDEIKCKFIDFQLSRRGSPVIDLMYFTINSVKFEVFDRNRDVLFNMYLHEFNSTLENIDGVTSSKNLYTLDEFLADWEEYKLSFFYVLIGVAPPLWAGDYKTSGDDSEENNIDVLFKSEEYRSAFRGWIKHLLPVQ